MNYFLNVEHITLLFDGLDFLANSIYSYFIVPYATCISIIHHHYTHIMLMEILCEILFYNTIAKLSFDTIAMV